jgi:hypothetical protein
MLNVTPRENRAKKIDDRIFFFHFYESSGRKKLINNFFILKDMGRNRKKQIFRKTVTANFL